MVNLIYYSTRPSSLAKDDEKRSVSPPLASEDDTLHTVNRVDIYYVNSSTTPMNSTVSTTTERWLKNKKERVEGRLEWKLEIILKNLPPSVPWRKLSSTWWGPPLQTLPLQLCIGLQPPDPLPSYPIKCIFKIYAKCIWLMILNYLIA